MTNKEILLLPSPLPFFRKAGNGLLRQRVQIRTALTIALFTAAAAPATDLSNTDTAPPSSSPSAKVKSDKLWQNLPLSLQYIVPVGAKLLAPHASEGLKGVNSQGQQQVVVADEQTPIVELLKPLLPNADEEGIKALEAYLDPHSKMSDNPVKLSEKEAFAISLAYASASGTIDADEHLMTNSGHTYLPRLVAYTFMAVMVSDQKAYEKAENPEARTQALTATNDHKAFFKWLTTEYSTAKTGRKTTKVTITTYQALGETEKIIPRIMKELSNQENVSASLASETAHVLEGVMTHQEEIIDNFREEHPNANEYTVGVVLDAARQVGIDPAIPLGVVEGESKFDPKAQNGSIKGLFQYTEDGWLTALKTFPKKEGGQAILDANPKLASLVRLAQAKKIGNPALKTLLAARDDPELNALVGTMNAKTSIDDYNNKNLNKLGHDEAPGYARIANMVPSLVAIIYKNSPNRANVVPADLRENNPALEGATVGDVRNKAKEEMKNTPVEAATLIPTAPSSKTEEIRQQVKALQLMPQ